MRNIVNISVKNNCSKEQTLYLSVFDFMGFKLLHEYNYNYISILKQLLEATKEITMALLNIFIFVSCYYICIRTYSFSNDNCELITACTSTCPTNLGELKPASTPNAWHKSIIDDFFSKFTLKGKTFKHEFVKIRPSLEVLPLNYNQNDIIEKSIILSKIKYDHMSNLISECEFYKNKTSLLEIQVQSTRIVYFNLVNDLNYILKDVNHWRIQ